MREINKDGKGRKAERKNLPEEEEEGKIISFFF